jgi:hypothetical protein
MGATVNQIGSIMQRDGSFIEPSALERGISEACHAAGIPFRWNENNYGEKVAEVGESTSHSRGCELGSTFYQALRAQLETELAALQLAGDSCAGGYSYDPNAD